METLGFIRPDRDGCLLAIKLTPRASKNQIGEIVGGELRVKVTAPPVDAAANQALVELLAETLDLPRNRIALVRGHTSRHKTIHIQGVTPGQIQAALAGSGA